jgi:hypothetical protein
MKAGYFSISAWAQQEISIISPTQICDTHHAEVHHYRKRFLKLWFPYRDRWVLRDNGNNTVAIQLSAIRLKEPRIDSWDIDAAVVARKTSHEVPRRSADEWNHVLSANAASRGWDERAIWGPGESSVDTHTHRLLEVGGDLCLFG